MELDLNEIRRDIEEVLTQFFSIVKMRIGNVMVIGCSTSAVCGRQMGKASSPEVAEVLFEVIDAFSKKHSIDLGFQCCEHLNRAIVVERRLFEKLFLTEVSVLPQVKAGGALATKAYNSFEDPVVVEYIQGHAAIDIGNTLIGMHVLPVAVPVHLAKRTVGSAMVTAAKTRPKLIGGMRAVYS